MEEMINKWKEMINKWKEIINKWKEIINKWKEMINFVTANVTSAKCEVKCRSQMICTIHPFKIKLYLFYDYKTSTYNFY